METPFVSDSRKELDGRALSRLGSAARLGMRRVAEALVDSYREAGAEAAQAPHVAEDLARIQFLQGWTGLLELEELYLLASTVPDDEVVVEVGSYCGRSTAALALGAGCRDHAVVTIDPHTGDIGQSEVVLPSSEPVLRYNLALAGVTSAVDVQVMTSEDAAAAYVAPPSVGMLFVDGWHTRDAVIADVRAWSRHLSSDAVVVFDDWHWVEVMAGIREAEAAGLLPERLGCVSNHLVFGSSSRVAQVLPRLRTLAELAMPRRKYLREQRAPRRGSRTPAH